MRFVSWNVNGIRAVLNKNFYEVFARLDADIFAIQETKCQAGQCAPELPGFHQFWSYAHRKGYSGTAVFSRLQPARVLHGIGIPDLDTEGRVVACEFDNFWFVSVYTPNSQNELARIEHRMAWEDAFRNFLKNLELGKTPTYTDDFYSEGEWEEDLCKSTPPSQSIDGDTQATKRFACGKNANPRPEAGDTKDTAAPPSPSPSSSLKPVIVCGDLNVAHADIDLKNPGPNRGSAGFSDEERGRFDELLAAGFVDTFRALYPDREGAYTWWSYQRRARATNAGWRIDYFLVSDFIRDKIEDATIYSDILGSDHCPVGLDINI